jgi:hypothetical protein
MRRVIRFGTKIGLRQKYGRMDLQNKVQKVDREVLRIRWSIWFKTAACRHHYLRDAKGVVLETLRAWIWRIEIRALMKDLMPIIILY